MLRPCGAVARVINHAGRITIARAGLNPEVQDAAVEDEGGRVRPAGYVDMRRYGWRAWSGQRSSSSSSVLRCRDLDEIRNI